MVDGIATDPVSLEVAASNPFPCQAATMRIVPPAALMKAWNRRLLEADHRSRSEMAQFLRADVRIPHCATLPMLYLRTR